MKSLSVPRGELAGSQLAVCLVKQLELNMSTVTFLSDSTAAFFVIRGEPRGLLPTASVENHYRKCNHAQCNHVPTKQNLADTATRDIAAGDLTANSEWIQGPEFL